MLGPFAGQQHLDVAGGTGDVAFRVLRAIQAAEQIEQQRQGQHRFSTSQPQPQPQVDPAIHHQQQQQHPQENQLGHVTVFDINGEMLEVGKSRAHNQGSDCCYSRKSARTVRQAE